MYYPSAVPVTQHSEQMTGLVPNVTNQSGDPLLNDSHKLTDESCKEKEQEKEKELGETSDQEDEATLDKETGAASGKEQFTIALNTQ
jgi:hypothetical protein